VFVTWGMLIYQPPCSGGCGGDITLVIILTWVLAGHVTIRDGRLNPRSIYIGR
jgi:hypothetical protein